MKRVILQCITLLFITTIYAQNVGINDDNSEPDGSAMLDVKSTSKGILIPRMTQAERNLITNPATGLMVYQTDNTAGFYYFNGASWLAIGSSYTETDPVYSSSASSGIAGSDITNWNTAFGWGKGWAVTGNSGTNPDNQFLGTTDDVPLLLRTNNVERMRINTEGNIGIGTNNPTQKLSVHGNISIRQSENNTDRFEVHVNRGMVNFATLPGDDHLVIYNNFNNIDDEGSWDGMKMNVYQGLNVRVGDHGANSALFIDAGGNTGMGNTSPQRRLEVAAGGSWISGTFSGTGGTDKVVLGNLNNRATIAAHTADFTDWRTLAINTDGVSTGGDVIMGFNSKVGIGTNVPASSAIVDITSTTKGFLPPRMTQTQRESVESPVAGLLVYQTDGTDGLYYYTGIEWLPVNEPQIETDPVFDASASAVINSSDITNWDNAYGWDNHANAGYLTSYTENDPVFSTAPSAGITGTHITNWNTAHGWGNHASAGYLTNYTENDPIFLASPSFEIDGSDITNWNTAYSWGQGWALAGNSGTNPANQFMGTTDNAGLAFRTNNTEHIRITPSGNVGIGTDNPTQKLDVQGSIVIGESSGASDYNEVNINRGRLKYSTEVDNNHAIYNNFRNIDGEGQWDGIKMNVYNGLNVRVGYDGSTPALYINSSGYTGLGTTTPVTRLDVAAGEGWISGTFSGNGGTDRVVIGNSNSNATIGAHNSAFTEWETLNVNTDGLSFGGNVIMGIGSQVGIGTPEPDASAILDVSSTSKGFLPPRMTAAQRSAISSPATGLTVYQTDGTTGLYNFNGTSWNPVYQPITESDPVYLASAAGGIASTDVNHWNSAYGWGNHASAGYLTSYTETDPVFGTSAAAGITNGNISNWNTAFGYGQGWKMTGNSGTNPSSNFLGTADNVGFAIRTNNTERLRISSTGNVGIGTDVPAQKLDVQGNIAIKTSTASSDRYEVQVNRGRINFSSVANDNNHVIYNNGNNIDGEGAWDGMKMNVYNGLNVRVSQSGAASALFIDSDGDVGLGTTSPTQKLDIGGSMTIAESYGGIAEYMINVNRGRLKFSSDNDNNHAIYNNYRNIDGEGSWDGLKMNVYAGLNIRTGYNGSTSALYINSDGKVGINTTSPSYQLTVNGSVALRETGPSPTYYTVLTAGDQNQNITYTLPISYPAGDGYYLKANSSGIMSWSNSAITEVQTLADVLAQGTDAGNRQIVNIAAQAIGTTTPNASAAFEVNSTTKGVLLPRLTKVQIAAIAGPSEGLLVYNTTDHDLAYYNGNSWFDMNDQLIFEIGDTFEGGIIFYIDNTGQHGLICAPSDQGSATWGCYGTNLPGAEGTAIGTGNQNTSDIMSGCSTAGIAARICGDLSLNGYDDWYLPSKDELNSMYTNLKAQGLGGFANNAYYYSSSEADLEYAWAMFFGNDSGTWNQATKSYSQRVRAIRAF